MTGAGAGPVRHLSPEEIEATRHTITPVERINYHRRWGRISFPDLPYTPPRYKFCWKDGK